MDFVAGTGEGCCLSLALNIYDRFSKRGGQMLPRSNHLLLLSGLALAGFRGIACGGFGLLFGNAFARNLLHAWDGEYMAGAAFALRII